MQYTRANVNLRAYGQRDPLIEYRKEGTALFAQMQRTILQRIVEAIPQIEPILVIREDQQHKKDAEVVLRSSNTTVKSSSVSVPRSVSSGLARNDLVTISNGTETQTMKFKKAEPLIATGWNIISK
jgi:preprotein translocase subunit SecA